MVTDTRFMTTASRSQWQNDLKIQTTMVRIDLADYAKRKHEYDYFCVGLIPGNNCIYDIVGVVDSNSPSATTVKLVRGNQIKGRSTGVPAFCVSDISAGGSGVLFSNSSTPEDVRIIPTTFIASDEYLYIATDTLPAETECVGELSILIHHYALGKAHMGML